MARFTFRDELQARQLANALARFEADLLVAGPVTRIGMEGGGTPDEIRDFMTLVETVQADAGGTVAVALVHHENRAGQVSGAWEAVPDVLAHVQALGHGRTRIFWQKARWSSALHGTTTNLLWATGDTFTVEQREEVTEASMADQMLAAALELPGGSWSKIRAKVTGNATEAANVRDRLIADGLLVNTSARNGQFNLWHHEDPAATRSELGTALERLTIPPTGSGAEPTRSTVPPLGRNGGGNGTAQPVADGVLTLDAREIAAALRTTAKTAESMDGWDAFADGVRHSAFRLEYIAGRLG